MAKKPDAPIIRLIVDNRSFEIEVDNSEDEYRVLVDGRNYHIHLRRRAARAGRRRRSRASQLQGRQKVSVPMPGKIIAVLVAEGDAVEKGQGLVIVEAMKMENEVHSPIAGEVKEIKVKAGRHRRRRRGAGDRRISSFLTDFLRRNCCQLNLFML